MAVILCLLSIEVLVNSAETCAKKKTYAEKMKNGNGLLENVAVVSRHF